MKKENTIGCCGIDCGLCPRFYTDGSSACPGCCGKDFKDKHPACGFVTCCVKKGGFETCADCEEFPCVRFEKERKGYDSFVSHKKVLSNLDDIKCSGLNLFLDRQGIRMGFIKDFLTHFDDGRSKSFFCLACTLLPIDCLSVCQQKMNAVDPSADVKQKNRLLNENLERMAKDLNIELKLNRPVK